MLKKYFPFLAILFLLNIPSKAQWHITLLDTAKYHIPTNPPLVYYSKQYLWAGSKLSTDTGKTLVAVNKGFDFVLNDSVLMGQGYIIKYKKQMWQKSTDYGKTWDVQYFINGKDTGLIKSSAGFYNAINEKYAYIVADTSKGCHEIWRTEDGGNNWNRLPCNAINFFIRNNSVDKYCNIGSMTYIVNPRTFNSLVVAKDFGKIWDSIHIDNNKIQNIRGIAFSDTLNGLLTYRSIYAADTTTFLMKTNNGGKTWQAMNELGLSVMYYAKATKKIPGYYIAQYGAYPDKGAKVSFDNGYTWKRLDSLYHTKFYFSDAENGISSIYKDTFAQLAVFTGFPAGFASNAETVKTKPSIRIYPNPANDIIHIESGENGNYEILNISGQVLASGITLAHQSNLISLKECKQGLYFVRCYGSNFCSTHKVVIME